MDDSLFLHSNTAKKTPGSSFDADDEAVDQVQDDKRRSNHAGQHSSDFSDCEVRIEQGINALLSLENAWRSLSTRLPQPCFIYDFDWHFLYIRHLATNPDEIYYLSFFSMGEAVAIFPLRRIQRSIGRLPLYLWEYPGHKHLTLCDPLIAPTWVNSGLLSYLRQALNTQKQLPWDALHFHHLPDHSPIQRLLSSDSPVMRHVEQTGRSMYFVCNDIDSALARCSSEFMRNLRRQERKLSSRGKVEIIFASSQDELDAAFADFLRLEASGWKGSEGKASAIACHSELLGFYEEMKARFGATNSCLIALLKLDRQAVAAQVCLRSDRTLYIHKIAYDESLHAEAPGSQLLLRLIEYVCKHPDLDRLSLITAPGWAERWKPESTTVREGFIFNTTPRGVCALLMRRLKTQVILPGQQLWQRLRNTSTTPANSASASTEKNAISQTTASLTQRRQS